MHPVHQPEYVPVGPHDIRKAAVFIEFVPVTELDINEIFTTVEIQCVQKNEGVVHEIVGPVPQSPVKIAEDHDPRVYGQLEYLLVLCKNFIQGGADSQ